MWRPFTAFSNRYGLENDIKVNIEQGHAILAGHSFEHEIAVANAFGIFGSIDMNRNDYQSGWDTDQFPNNVPEVALAYYHILKGRRFHDRRHQLRRQTASAIAGSGRPSLRPYRRHGHLCAWSEGGGEND